MLSRLIQLVLRLEPDRPDDVWVPARNRRVGVSAGSCGCGHPQSEHLQGFWECGGRVPDYDASRGVVKISGDRPCFCWLYQPAGGGS